MCQSDDAAQIERQKKYFSKHERFVARCRFNLLACGISIIVSDNFFSALHVRLIAGPSGIACGLGHVIFFTPQAHQQMRVRKRKRFAEWNKGQQGQYQDLIHECVGLALNGAAEILTTFISK
jgi:hypothetical protein